MAFEDGLFALVTGTTAISTLIGSRMYPSSGPISNPVYPYIAFWDVTASSDYGLDGSESRMRLFQFDVWANDPDVGKGVLIALRNLLSSYTGTLNDGSRVLFCARGNEMSNFDVNQREYRSVVEYEFEISEA